MDENTTDRVRMIHAAVRLDGGWTMAKVIEASKRGAPHFFDEGTVAFWGSKWYDPVFVSADLSMVYFVTSENDWSGRRRLFSVRRLDVLEGTIETCQFQCYETQARATTAARRLAQGLGDQEDN